MTHDGAWRNIRQNVTFMHAHFSNSRCYIILKALSSLTLHCICWQALIDIHFFWNGIQVNVTMLLKITVSHRSLLTSLCNYNALPCQKVTFATIRAACYYQLSTSSNSDFVHCTHRIYQQVVISNSATPHYDTAGCCADPELAAGNWHQAHLMPQHTQACSGPE